MMLKLDEVTEECDAILGEVERLAGEISQQIEMLEQPVPTKIVRKLRSTHQALLDVQTALPSA